MPPDSTTWQLENHTIGKHKVLENYMGAWLPIMSRWNGRVLFIDAFAGPGEYSHGEPGSPLIALNALIDHRSRQSMQSRFLYLFIEKDEARSRHLERVLANHGNRIPANCSYRVINSTFDATLTAALDAIDQQNTRLAPSFVMIDPFGVSDTPMSLIGRIQANDKSEVYISFMYREINRFMEHPNFERHMDDLFGCPDWRNGIEISESQERKEFFYNLYGSQLKKHGAKYVIRFELFEGGQLVYAIFFGTKSLAGCDKMKQAIWKVAPFGDFRFRGSKHNQLTLGDSMVDFTLLEKELQDEFKSKGWRTIEEVEAFVKSDATDFHSSHLKRQTLKPMEAAGKVEVVSKPNRRPGTFAAGTKLRFL